MAPDIAPKQDIITPAEAQFWQEWADKAPARMRQEFNGAMDTFNSQISFYKMVGIALGAVLGAATFTKYIPGKWKWGSGAAAVASVGAGLMVGTAAQAAEPMKMLNELYVSELEKNPQLRQQLANYLSSHITGEDIQKNGIEQAVLTAASEFGATQTPYFQPENMKLLLGGTPQRAR